MNRIDPKILRQLREQNGWSQEKLSEVTQLGRSGRIDKQTIWQLALPVIPRGYADAQDEAKRERRGMCVGRQFQGALELPGLQAVRWKARRVFGRLNRALLRSEAH